jgi:quercetin dioxygenase-like cupin family protein
MTDWFVRNARDLEWTGNRMGDYCDLLQGGDAAAEEFAINLNVLPKDAPMALYHHEPHQEGFLVLRGECRVRVDGEEHPLREWDYFHCPPGVAHVVIGASDEPALVLAVGSRVGGGRATYPEDPDPRGAYEAYGKHEQVASPL